MGLFDKLTSIIKAGSLSESLNLLSKNTVNINNVHLHIDANKAFSINLTLTGTSWLHHLQKIN